MPDAKASENRKLNFNNESTRSSVLKAVADTGNEAAWRRFFDLYAGLVFSIARSKGLADASAASTVQCSFRACSFVIHSSFPKGKYGTN